MGASHREPSNHRLDPQEETGPISWIFSLDHKRIAVLQLGGIGLALVAGGVLALILRYGAVAPGLGGEDYQRVVAAHGALLMFMVALPGIAATLGSYVLPLQLGAENVAFPRLNLAALHLWAVGAVLVLLALAEGGVAVPLTLPPPASLLSVGPVAPLGLGLMVLVISAVMRGIVLLVTLHTQRRAGMVWGKVSALGWSLYAYSVLVIMAGPVFLLALLLLLAERSLGLGFFEPALGGDPLLHQALLGISAQPLLVASVLPALGLISEVLATFTGKSMNRRLLASGIVGSAVVGLFSWGQFWLSSGHSMVLGLTFSLIALLGAIPVCHLVLGWLGMLQGGAIRLRAPFILALGFIANFLMASLAGLFLATASTGVHLQGTAFEAGQSHYWLVGGGVTAWIAGIHYFWPKITGRTYDEPRSRWLAVAWIVGTQLAFFPMLAIGSQGWPRRQSTLPGELSFWGGMSGLGAVLLFGALLLMAYNLLNSLRKRPDAAADPWDARTLEWTCSSPPSLRNFPEHESR